MAYWEFLLQKEGDRSWLPLESPDVEILEGRYRVVARSNRVNTVVEVRIIHHVEEANQPKRRSQKRTTKTNQDGLVVVLPFTWLQPGLWELRCASDVMADMMGESWQHGVQLDVQPQGSSLDDEWDADLGGNAAEPPAPELTVPAELNGVAAGSDAVVDDIESASAEPEPIAESPPSAEPLGAEPTPPQLPADLQIRVQMDQESYAMRRGHPLVVTGTILTVRSLPPDVPEPNAESSESSSEFLPLPPGYIQTIQIRLLNPQTADIATEQAIALEVPRLPFAFTCQVNAPDAAETHLFVGQLTVLGAENQPLTQQSFTVTADLDALLAAIANEAFWDEMGETADLTSPFGAAEPPDLTLLNLISAVRAEAEDDQFQVTNTEPIPPQLYHPDPSTEGDRRPLDLPTFAPPAVQDADAETAASTMAPGADPLKADSERSQAADSFLSAIEATEPSTPPAESAAVGSPDAVPAAEIEPPVTASALPVLPSMGEQSCTASSAFEGDHSARQAVSLSPTDLEFQALNLQDRFLARLSALASDTDLQTWLRSQYPATDSQTLKNGHAPSPSVSAPVPDRPVALDDPYATHEFVIDDEDAIAPAAPLPMSSLSGTSPEIPDALKLPDDQPIPPPQLTLRSQDLIAGQPLQIVVTVPNGRSRMSVKLWLQDPQTRDLLDGPYWLTTFSPNGHDQLESGLQVMVPFGCLDVQVEAIAVEVASQRESRKITVHRRVVPPDLSPLIDDELDL